MRSAVFVSVFSLLGGIFLLLGIVLMLEPSSVYAQEEVKEYYGLKECNDCHGRLARSLKQTPHGKTLIKISDSEADQALILADFSLDEELRTVQFPGESSPRAFTAQDVAYTLGSGRNLQAYVYQGDDGSLMVLPAQWNIKEKKWQALDLAGSWPDTAYDFVDNCAYCHVTGLDLEKGKWVDDGVQCEACHGPGSVHVDLMDTMDELTTADDRAALNASINIAVDAQVCGQCHSQGKAPDEAHPYPIGYVPGDALVDSFSLVPTDDAFYWYASGHASQQNMQYNEWIQTAHAKSYSDAESSEFFSLDCLICHGESYRRAVELLNVDGADPEILPIPNVEAERIPVGVTCSSCHNPHEEVSEDESPASQAAANYQLCTSCHHSSSEVSVRHHPVQEVFEGQEIVDEITPITGVHFSKSNGPRCVTCHVPQVPIGNGTKRFSHALKPVLPKYAEDSTLQDSCTQCHDKVEPQGMQKLIDSVQSNVHARYDAARAALKDDSPAWVEQTLDVIAGDGSWGIHNYDYINQMLKQVESELGLAPKTAALELPNVATQVAPAAEQVSASGTPEAVAFGLTWPSLLFMGIVFGIIGFAAYAFFFKGEDA